MNEDCQCIGVADDQYGLKQHNHEADSYSGADSHRCFVLKVSGRGAVYVYEVKRSGWRRARRWDRRGAGGNGTG